MPLRSSRMCHRLNIGTRYAPASSRSPHSTKSRIVTATTSFSPM